MDSTGDRYSAVKAALLPMLIVGAVVGTGASGEQLWGLFGVGLAFCVWLGWATAVILGRAWIETRKARR